MKYLVVYPNYDRQTEEKEIFADAGSAAEYIQGILRAGTVKDEQVGLYEIKPVAYEIERIPVVKIGAETEELAVNAANIVPEITTEEEVAEEQAKEAETLGENAESDVEVFTFES